MSSKYIWKNVQWNKDYASQWSYHSEGIHSDAFIALQKCFQDVFGLTLTVISTDGSADFSADVVNGVPQLSFSQNSGVQLQISGLQPSSLIRMRQAGSNNTNMVEQQADNDGQVILQGQSKTRSLNSVVYFGEIATTSMTTNEAFLWNMNPSQAHWTCDANETIESYYSDVFNLSSISLDLEGTKVNDQPVRGSHILQFDEKTPASASEPNSWYGFIDPAQTTLGRYWHFCDYIYDYHNMFDQRQHTFLKYSGNSLVVEQTDADGETTTTVLKNPFGVAVVWIPPLSANIEYDCNNQYQERPNGYEPDEPGGWVIHGSDRVTPNSEWTLAEHYYNCDLGTYTYGPAKYYIKPLNTAWQIDSNEFDSQYNWIGNNWEEIGTDHWLHSICNIECTSMTLIASIPSVYDSLQSYLINQQSPPSWSYYDFRSCYYGIEYFTAYMDVKITLNNIPAIVAKQSYANLCEIDYGSIEFIKDTPVWQIGVPEGWNITGPSFSSSWGKWFRTDGTTSVEINSAAQCFPDYSFRFWISKLKAKWSNTDGWRNGNGRSNGFYCIVVWGAN